MIFEIYLTSEYDNRHRIEIGTLEDLMKFIKDNDDLVTITTNLPGEYYKGVDGTIEVVDESPDW